jgi:lysophospholipase L1-like esterase
MGILDAPSYSKTQSDSLYARKNRIRAAALSGQLSSATSTAYPAIVTATNDIPVITHSTTSSVTSSKKIPLTDSSINFVCAGSTYDSANSRWKTVQSTTIEFVLCGTTAELIWVAAGGTGSDIFWIWVNGKPLTATPATTNATTSLGTVIYTKLVFPTSAPKSIQIMFESVNSTYGINVPITTAIAKQPKKLKGLFIGDSFFGGAGGYGALNYMAHQVSRLLGTECANYGQGGTGYVATGSYTTFGDTTKTTYASTYNPDFIIIQGSVNDDGLSGIGTAVTNTIAAFATAVPNVPIIVFGPQPSNSTSTISTNRQTNNAAVKTAALANSATIAYFDEIGNVAGAVSAWSSATTYNTGDLVSYIGSIWQWGRPVSASNVTPGGTANAGWSLVTYLYTGTGKIGTTTADGSRDLFLLSDGVHPSQDGATALSLRMAAEIRQALLTFATS